MLGFKDFSVIPSIGPEVIYEGFSPSEAVIKIANTKALEVAKKAESGDLVIAADTLVCLDGEFLGKPESREDAFRMLRSLSGRSHTVYTGVSVICGSRSLDEAEATTVSFRELSDSEILNYIETGEPMDKAGAYGAQGLGSLFIKGIDGDFFNVMGLPLCRLGLMLRAFGLEILDLNKGGRI